MLKKNYWSQTGKYLIGDYCNSVKITHDIYFLLHFKNIIIKKNSEENKNITGQKKPKPKSTQLNGNLYNQKLEYAFRMETILKIFYAHIHNPNKKFHEIIRTGKRISIIDHFITCFLPKSIFKSLRNMGLYCKAWKKQKYTSKSIQNNL